MSPTYGYAYLTSYGWTGTGTGLRNGAIERPLAIPPKKNLSGLGKDRDEAFPFWDHLFTAASKAITIKVSSDDEDTGSEDPSDTDPKSVPLRRTTTGIISNRRPVSGTPASTSGSVTPSLDADADTRLSLLAIAKREAAKRGLYARFFRGPVLGPDDPSAGTPPHMAALPSSSSPTSTPVPEYLGDRQDGVGGTNKGKKRKSGDKETKEERRERKRLKKERQAARASKRAEKALAGDTTKKKKDRLDRKARKHRDEETRAEENGTFVKARKRARTSVAGSAGEDLEQAKCTRKTEKLASTDNERQDTCSHRPPRNVDAINVVVTTKKKRKRKDTPS